MSLTQANHDTTAEEASLPVTQPQVDVASIVTSLPPLATTNYGSQVAYNYGSISNYFCHNDPSIHHHDFPKSNLHQIPQEHGLSDKLDQARSLLSAGKHLDSKLLLYEVLHTEDDKLDNAQRAAVKFSLGHAHFSAAEYAEALSNFEAVSECVDIQEDDDNNEEVGTTSYWLGRCHFQLKNYNEASAVLRAYITSHDDCSDTEHITNAHLWLGMTLDCLGSHDSAREQLQCAWRLREQAHGAEHLDTLAGRHHLANLCFKQKSYAEARDHFQWLLEVEERLSGPEKSQAVITRSMLAFTFCELGDIQSAAPHLQRVISRIELQDTFSADENRNLGLVRYWVGRDHLRQRRFDQARAMFQRALMLLTQEQELADKVLDCQLYMGIALNQQQDYRASEQILERVLKMTRERDHDNLIKIIYWLASSLIQQRKYEEARDVLDDIIITPDVIQASMWTGSDSAACLYLRGEIHFKLKNYSEARNCFGTLVDVEPAKPNSFTHCYRFWMGKTLYKLEKFEDARPFFQATFDSCRHGSDLNSGCVDCIAWLAWVLAEVNEHDLAETHLRRTLQFFPHTSNRPTPKENTFLGRTKYYLGKMLVQKDLKEATKLLRESVVMLGRSFGEKESIYLQCRYQLARCLIESREYDQAQAILQDLRAIQHTSRAVQTICTFSAPYRMSTVYIRLSKFTEAREILLKCLTVWSETIVTEIDMTIVKHDLAFCDLKIGNLEACINELKPVVENIDWNADHQRSINFKLINYLSRALYFSYRYAEAAPLLEKYVAYKKTLSSCATTAILEFEAYLADCYCEMGRYDDARPILTSGALLNDASPGTALGFCRAICKYWLGRMAVTDSNYAEAEKFLVEAMRLLGNRQWLYSERMRHSCRLFLADISLKRKRFSEAEVMFTELLGHPVEDYFSSTTTDIQYLLGVTLKRQSKFVKARETFMAVLPNASKAKLIPQFLPSCQFQLAGILYDLCEFKAAEQYFQQAAEYNGSTGFQFDAQAMVGNCNFQLGNFEQARQVFESLIKDDGQRTCCLSTNRFHLGQALHRLERFEEAEAHFDYALEKLPSDSKHKTECQFLAADTAFTLKKYSRAVVLLSTIKRTRDDSNLTMSIKIEILLARCYFEMNDFQEAAEVYDDCFAQESLADKLNLEYEYRLARLYYARCLKAVGKSKQAKRELELTVPFFASRLAQKDPAIVHVEFELGDIAYMECRFNDAADLLKDALLHYQYVGTTPGFDVWHCRQIFGHVLHKLGNHNDAILIYRQFYRRKLTAGDKSSVSLEEQIDLWHTLRHNNKHTEALAFAQERLALTERQCEVGSDAALKVRLDLIEVAFDLHDWQMVVDTADRIALHFDHLSTSGTTSTTNLSRFYAKYSFALRMLDWHDESKKRALQAVNICRRKNIIRSVDCPDYEAAFRTCLGLDPAEVEAIVQGVERHSEQSEAGKLAHNPVQDFSDIIAYGEVESRAQPATTPIPESSTLHVASVDDVPQVSPTAITPTMPPSPMRVKPPRPPKPPKSPGLMDRLNVQMRTQSVR